MVINCSAEIAKFLTSNPIHGVSVFILQTPDRRLAWSRVPDNAQSEGGDRREAA